MKLLNVTNGNYTIETYYNNVLYDTTQIEVKSFEQIGYPVEFKDKKTIKILFYIS